MKGNTWQIPLATHAKTWSIEKKVQPGDTPGEKITNRDKRVLGRLNSKKYPMDYSEKRGVITTRVKGLQNLRQKHQLFVRYEKNNCVGKGGRESTQTI